MFDDKGKLVTSELEKAVDSPVDPADAGRRSTSARRSRAPGVYTLKVAVVDDAGKRGSVERTFTARINGFGQLHVTDLLIADNSVRGARRAAAGGGRRLHRRRAPRLRRAVLGRAGAAEERDGRDGSRAERDVARARQHAGALPAGAGRRRPAARGGGGRADRAAAAGRIRRARRHLGQRPQGRTGRQAVPRHAAGGDRRRAGRAARCRCARPRRSRSPRGSTPSTSRRC